MVRLLTTLLLIPSFAIGAMDFDGSTGYATGAVAEATAEPLTMCCMVNTDDATNTKFAFNLHDSGSALDTHTMSITTAGATGGDPIGARAKDAGAGGSGLSATGYSVGTWHSACARFVTDTSRSACIDGTCGTANTNSVVANVLNQTNIASADGASAVSTYDGRLAECGLWNRDLDVSEVATLGKGYAPPCIRRGLVGYYPMIRDDTTLKDHFSATANNLTLSGTTAVADHPRVINCQ